ncbi:hypothetical protein ANAPC5_01372 [Anaplasma phagocytophilum]|nr:hypothetical protein ANAPC5_01372 [Anaplasma phagocytophilum]
MCIDFFVLFQNKTRKTLRSRKGSRHAYRNQSSLIFFTDTVDIFYYCNSNGTACSKMNWYRVIQAITVKMSLLEPLAHQEVKSNVGMNGCFTFIE